MSATVIECCHGGVVHHRGKGRCAADQGGRTMEAKLGEFTRTAEDTYTLTNADGVVETIPVYPFEPDLIGFDCVNMIDCMMSTDPCGDPIVPFGFLISHVLVREPACDPGKVFFRIQDSDGNNVAELPADACVWLRFYGN